MSRDRGHRHGATPSAVGWRERRQRILAGLLRRHNLPAECVASLRHAEEGERPLRVGHRHGGVDGHVRQRFVGAERQQVQAEVRRRALGARHDTGDADGLNRAQLQIDARLLLAGSDGDLRREIQRRRGRVVDRWIDIDPVVRVRRGVEDRAVDAVDLKKKRVELHAGARWRRRPRRGEYAIEGRRGPEGRDPLVGVGDRRRHGRLRRRHEHNEIARDEFAQPIHAAVVRARLRAGHEAPSIARGDSAHHPHDGVDDGLAGLVEHGAADDRVLPHHDRDVAEPLIVGERHLRRRAAGPPLAVGAIDVAGGRDAEVVASPCEAAKHELAVAVADDVAARQPRGRRVRRRRRRVRGNRQGSAPVERDHRAGHGLSGQRVDHAPHDEAGRAWRWQALLRGIRWACLLREKHQ